MQITYRYRVRDKHATRLNAQAAAANFVWNYRNEMQSKAAKAGRKWLGYCDLRSLLLAT